MVAADSQPGGDYRPLRAARHERLTIDGARMGITRWGPESADPIVLLHGWMDVADSWQLLVDALPEWSFAALDWRGFGASEPRQGGYWGPQYLSDLEAALDELVPQGTVRLIGHSLGGTVASLYAGVRFERMRWLVNLEGFGLPQQEPATLPARLAQWLDQLQHVPVARHYESLDYLAARVLHTNPKLGPVRARFLAQVWSEAKDGGLQLRADPAHWVRGPLRYARAELEACWARIAVPTLLVAGGDSRYLRHLGASAAPDDWRKLYRHATLREVPGAGHLLHHEQPADVAAIIREFVESVESKGGATAPLTP